MGNHTIGQGARRTYRTFDFTAVADARTAAFAAASGTGNDGAGRALRSERRNRGSPGYDLLRHIGLIRRLRQDLRQHPAKRELAKQDLAKQDLAKQDPTQEHRTRPAFLPED